MCVNARRITRPKLRGRLLVARFGLGFFLGNARVDGQPSLPAAVVWGLYKGDVGVYALLWLGVVLVLAWLARLSGTAYLRGDVVFAANVQRDRLNVDGPFRYVRNPLYFGNILMALGIGLYAPPLGFATIVIGNTILVAMLAREEAQQLAAQYGAGYAAYRVAVPAFLPRLTPAVFPSAGKIQPHVRAALMAESITLTMAFALVPIAIMGQAGLIPAAAVFRVAMGLFVGMSRTGRRDARAG